MKKAKCPACKAQIKIKPEIHVQELILCPTCQSILELTNLTPPTLDWAEDPIIYSLHRRKSSQYS